MASIEFLGSKFEQSCVSCCGCVFLLVFLLKDVVGPVAFSSIFCQSISVPLTKNKKKCIDLQLVNSSADDCQGLCLAGAKGQRLDNQQQNAGYILTT